MMEETAPHGCPHIDLLLYHYGELEGEELRHAETHLAGCAPCREELAQLRRTLAAVPRPEVSLSPLELQRFTARVTGRLGRRRRRLPLVGGALAAGVALVITLVALQPGFLTGPPAQRAPSGVLQMNAEVEMLQDMDMLQNMDLLQNMDMLQDMEGAG